MHNALRQVKIQNARESISGFSISGLATYVQIPELDLVFDMGECPVSAIHLNHVFLTHAHGDHSRCLMRHYSLRRMTGIPHVASYYLPESIAEAAKNWILAESQFEGVDAEKFEMPNLVPVGANSEPEFFTHRKDLAFSAFEVKHRVPSLGYTIFDYKQKLKEEFFGTPGQELAKLRESGVEISRPLYQPRVTFIGDCIGESLKDNLHIWDSRILMLECTFIEADELEMARKKGHTHIQEIVKIMREMKGHLPEQIVLKHFSMKYSREHIRKKVFEIIPKDFHDRITLLL